MTVFKRILLCLVVNVHFTESIFLPYWKGKNHTSNSFHIPMNAIFMGNSKPKKDNTTQQYSLDERCSSGKPLSIAWHPYAPYVTMYQSKHNNKAGFTVTGMFPGILTRVWYDIHYPLAIRTRSNHDIFYTADIEILLSSKLYCPVW